MDTAVTVLNEEIHSIHLANRLYWNQKFPNREEKAKHERRQIRLEEIRITLSNLGCALDRRVEN
jgi:hypothetical protein